MASKLFQFNELEIWQEGDLFFAIADAGAHQVVWRKDEISREEVELALTGREGVMAMLLALQKRLTEAGVNPYVSNYDPNQLPPR